ncbi:hypothetical protein GCM10007907_15160 [Chitinimonas prasina]|uniref:Uncharacterized protein n=1 Tax=Chitinimonas prasina TaxID=1434937 RepID=A0ABQ5YCP2_9NEIS|nr:hypothetical protein GCM10007907_15160 [Chitinimonas prasina]
MMRRTRLALKLRCDMNDNWHGYQPDKMPDATQSGAIPPRLMGVLTQAACKGALRCL